MKFFSRSSLLVSFLFSLLGLVSPQSAQAQVTYVSPQTVYQKVFAAQTSAAPSPNSNSTTACVPTNGFPCGIPNLGQSIHSVVYTITSPCTAGFFMDLRIEASNDGANWFSISEDATDQNSGSVQGSTSGGLTATGSYNNFRLNLVSLACSSGQAPAITANYSGTSTSNPTSTGVFYQSSPYRKLIVQNQPTTSTLTPVTISAPNGNSAGALFVSCFIAASGASTSCPSGSTITITSYIAFGSAVGGGGGGNIPSGFASIGVPATVGPVLQIYTAPAVSMNFSFAGTGTAGVSWSVYYLSNSTPTSSFNGDPCAGSGSIKRIVSVNATATGQTGAGVTPIPGEAVYVCEIVLNMIGTTTADTIFFEQGVGNTCTTPSNTTATFSSGILTSGATEIRLGDGSATQYVASVGLGLCSVVSTIATGGNIAIHFTFVQQ